MTPTRATLVLIAAGGSAVLLAAAFVTQAFGWAPCKLCLWQRWPHGAAVLAGFAALALPGAVLTVLGALSALTTAGIGAYHGGVERGWWPGPDSCTGTGLSGLDGASLLPGSGDAPALVMCDSFQPFLFGLSMANWNMLASLALAAIWLMAARARA
ncbi:MAG: disulfide bond formation protein B [Roseovarius sp.]|nr:disulfide bond formation protein B [Roseovarius sp.]